MQVFRSLNLWELKTDMSQYYLSFIHIEFGGELFRSENIQTAISDVTRS